ncbi:MAG TPA: adenosylcobinamide-GDP ribazoletransferase [Actinomycetes bacterium]|nr:adenosylcobinamide-GDP ribazoletransferase [Actinomycetes bacterium]
MARVHDLREPLRLLAVAVGFLTRVPVPRTMIGSDDLRRASAWFPLVGLGIAGVGIAVRAAAKPIWGAGVGTIAAVAAMILVTGALHEDGLADTADGLWGGWDPAGRLAIMRDSRIGTYGAVALILVIALRLGLLLPLGLADFARAVACGHVLGRASTLLLARLLPAAPAPPTPDRAPGDPLSARSARPGGPPAAGGASGEALAGRRPRLGASVVGVLGPWGVGAASLVVAATVGLAARAWAPIPLAAALIVSSGCARLFRRRLGGATGDAFGAANQLVDLATVAAIAALVRAGLL